MKTLLTPDAPASAAPATLTPATASQVLTDLQAALEKADVLARQLLDDPAFARCPFVAAVRSGVNNGALNRLTHVKNWLAANPIPETK